MDFCNDPIELAKAKKAKEAPTKLLETSLDDYYYARMNEKAKNYENIFDDISYAPATEMEKARREIACLDNQLVIARSDWMQNKEKLDERWKTCAERFDACYDNIPKFNGYYKDTFAKRERSILAHIREKLLCEEKDRELRRLKKESDKLMALKGDVEQRLEKFSCFRTYLEKVKTTSQGEYQDVREIIDRYSVLAEARQSLGEKNEETRTTVQRRQKALEYDVVTKSNEVLAYRNYLSELLEYHDGLSEKVQSLDDSLLRIKTTAAQRTMIIGQIKMSIDNLYKQVCKSMHRPMKLPASDTIGQLTDVGISVREIYKLSKDIKHMLKAAFMTAEAEKAAQNRARNKEAERQKRVDKFINRQAGTDMRDLFGLPPIVEQNRKQEFDTLFANPTNSQGTAGATALTTTTTTTLGTVHPSGDEQNPKSILKQGKKKSKS